MWTGTKFMTRMTNPTLSFLSFIPQYFSFFVILVSTSVTKLAHAQTELQGNKKSEPVSSTSRRGARAAYHDEYPRDFGPRIAYTVS